MSEETTVDTGTDSQLAEQAIDTASVVDEITPDTPDQDNQDQQDKTPETDPDDEKKFSQKDLNKIIAKRVAREMRAMQREQEQRAISVQNVSKGDLNINDFETTDAYLEALATRKAEELVRHQRDVETRTAVVEKFEQSVEKASEKYPDFEELVFNPNLPVSTVMRDAIFLLDDGAEVLYHLGSNPAESARISKLPPVQQAIEIGRLHAKFAQNPPVKKVSNASAPISPIKAKGASPSYDTTDPRSISQMSTSEWIEAERRRQVRQWEAKNK